MSGELIPTVYYDDPPTKYMLRGLPDLFFRTELTGTDLADSGLNDLAAWYATARELGMTAVSQPQPTSGGTNGQ